MLITDRVKQRIKGLSAIINAIVDQTHNYRNNLLSVNQVRGHDQERLRHAMILTDLERTLNMEWYRWTGQTPWSAYLQRHGGQHDTPTHT